MESLDGMETKMKSLVGTISVFLFQLSIAFQFSIAVIILISISLSIPSESICFSKPAPDWTPISGNQYNMIAFGQIHNNFWTHLNIDGADQGQGRFILYSFGQKSEHDCRSKCNIGPAGAYYATIRGNTRGEAIGFKVYDCSNGKTYDLTDTVIFEIDAVVENFTIH